MRRRPLLVAFLTLVPFVGGPELSSFSLLKFFGLPPRSTAVQALERFEQIQKRAALEPKRGGAQWSS